MIIFITVIVAIVTVFICAFIVQDHIDCYFHVWLRKFPLVVRIIITIIAITQLPVVLAHYLIIYLMDHFSN